MASAKTDSRKSAEGMKARIEETISDLHRGRIVMPADADPLIFIVSGGKLADKPTLETPDIVYLGDACDVYLTDQHGKAENTLGTERTHCNNLRRVLGGKTKLAKMTIKEIQLYVNRRAREKRAGKLIAGETIHKELVTFTQVWAWAKQRGYVSRDCPVYDDRHKWAVKVEKPAEKEKFQTWGQIEKRIKRGGLTDAQKDKLWDSLYLDNDQVVELLAYVKKNALHEFIHPMFVFAAYTGARRSEICRSEIEDFDFDNKAINLREKKRRRDLASSFRFVELHPKLAEVMKAWFDEHPGGKYTIAAPLEMAKRPERIDFAALTPKEAYHHFKYTLKDSKWSVLRGFHVLRHSFGANLARACVPRDQIGAWMGHSTEEMKSLYQHLFPQDGAPRALFI
ncbi:MAG TPA: site-specific integrase [Pirellulales bacterium]|nr:site-specific integrase [Pirellulales bacterium]